MSIAELIPVARALSRREKFQLAQILLDDLARDESVPMFEQGKVYPIYTPEFAPGSAAVLAEVLIRDQQPS